MIIGIITACVAVAVTLGALGLGATAAGDANDLLASPPLNRTHGQTASERAEGYATAQGFDSLAVLASALLAVGAFIVLMADGAGPFTVLSLVAGLGGAGLALWQAHSHRTLAVGVEAHRADLREDGNLEQYPVAAE